MESLVTKRVGLVVFKKMVKGFGSLGTIGENIFSV